MSFFIGRWSCSLKSAGRPVPSHGAIVYSFDWAGYFIKTNVTHKGTRAPHDHFGTDRITYDDRAKRWITIVTESDGGFVVSKTAEWKGRRLVWHDVR